MKRKANGKQKAYEERIKAKKKAEIAAKKQAIRTEDIARGGIWPGEQFAEAGAEKRSVTETTKSIVGLMIDGDRLSSRILLGRFQWYNLKQL